MRLLPGTGRAVRHGGLIGFSASPIEGFASMLASDRGDVFKQLAALVVQRQFNLPPFAVVDTVALRVFVFGDLSLDWPGGSVSGRQATTWVEATLGDVHSVACGPTGAGYDLDTDLVAGSVPAGGFALQAVPEESQGGYDEGRSAPGAPIIPVEGPMPSPAMDPARDDPVTVAAQPDAPVPGEPPTRLSILDQPSDWNPLADPIGVDLASLGRVNRAPAAPVSTDLAAVAPPPAAPPPGRAAAPGDEGAAASAGTEGTEATAVTTALHLPLATPAGPLPDIPPPPSGPIPSLVPLDDDPGATLPEVPSPAVTAELVEDSRGPVRLRCDDGQLIEVPVGAYVGRHPTKGGLPEGYVAVTVRGEHVSRLHWKLMVASDSLLVADLGSASGTSIQLPGWNQTAALDGTEPTVVPPGTTVHFADRWAVVEA